ncbi:hypothetical protein GUITHDRAFT_100118 [Guillardia theta CCMP2712]|uniref:N-acetyl-D-glucosamine kinase n=1 Tax=Guillardia theta (strain CCMP2712) TaxID=905079 RepID=L1K2P6_GUITC|nr:hypothetical protein GUITHDRAFT_100118 [Guillardia theta CCMP2712]EKX54643.1 hypothetical protein GUITHDRAFT_100118 [Guillardia theta CCMP2712]|eukprot:XP_005841623.1 hypothetical protein GUITHDRAFT_100118 [Guillardia theta CCMP2712]
MLVIGVDGGATKTEATVMDGEGQIVGKATSGSTNKNSVGKDQATMSLVAAVQDSLKAGNADMKDVQCIVLGMSGCDTPSDVDFWLSICASKFPSCKAIVENDSVIALCSGTGGRMEGIVVISGTGSIGLGISQGGSQRVRVGGMGPLLGDSGNGYSMGAAALRAAVRASDGRGPTTELLGMILDKYKVPSADGLLEIAYGKGTDVPAKFASWDEVASLAPLVVKAKREHGCSVASQILEQTAQDICELAETVAARLSCSSSDSETFTMAKVTRPNMTPSEAAARMALTQLR